MNNLSIYEGDIVDLPSFLRAFSSIYLSLSILGIYGNGAILWSTFRHKSLHNSCNLLIAISCFFDLLHLLGHFIFFYYSNISQDPFEEAKTCLLIITIPYIGLSGGTLTVLLIGFDRLYACLFPTRYSQKSETFYMFIHIILLYLYIHFQISTAYETADERRIICFIPEGFQGDSKKKWAFVSVSVYISTFIIYTIVWIKLHLNDQIRQIRRIFRSLFIIMIVEVGGWLISVGVFAFAIIIFPDLTSIQILILHCISGLAVNITISFPWAVYYCTSIDYRRALRQHCFIWLKVDSIPNESTSLRQKDEDKGIVKGVWTHSTNQSSYL